MKSENLARLCPTSPRSAINHFSAPKQGEHTKRPIDAEKRPQLGDKHPVRAALSLVPPEGFEPPTYGTGNRRSIP